MCKVKVLYRKLSSYISYDNITMNRLQRTVNHGYISIADASLNHRIPINTTVECSRRIFDEVTVEVQRFA